MRGTGRRQRTTSTRTRTRYVWLPALLLSWVGAGSACHPGRGASAESPARAPGIPEGPDIVRRMIGEQLVVVRADSAQHLELDNLFDHLWVIKDQGAVFHDAQPVPLGWTTVWLSARRAPDGSSYFMVQEPVYEGAAEDERRDDLSVTLGVLAGQRRVLALSGADAQTVDYDQHLLVVRGALDTPQVYLTRVASPGGRMTGWRVAPLEIEGEMEIDSLTVYELYRRRPALAQALMLPDGWMAYFDDAELMALVDPHDQLVWSSTEPDPSEGATSEEGGAP